MNPETKQPSDPRLHDILDFIRKLASGNPDASIKSSKRGDGLDEIIAGLNVLAKKLSPGIIPLSKAAKRLDEIMEVVLAIASLDYSKKAPVGNDLDVFDAIGTGLNALSEELQISTVSKDYLDNIIQTMTDTLIVVNPDETIRTVNQTALDILGYREEELIGKPIEKIFGKKVKDADLIAGKTERTYRTKDGREIPMFFSGSVMHDEHGRVQGIVCVAQDITERKRAEESLRTAYKELAVKAAELEKANEELSQYAYAVSHDVMAPLRAIQNYADFLREDLETTLDEEQKTYLDGLDLAVRQGKKLVEDLLELSRIGRENEKIETIDMGTFLRQLTASLDLPPDVEIVTADDFPIIEAGQSLLRQIFQNLIINAVKFNRSSPKRVELGWTPSGENRCELFVRDNGIGIDARYQEQIFRVFHRLHASEEYEGTGIGLAVVKKAVDRLHGSIRVESTPGQGSTFFISLPREQMAKGE